KVFPKTAFESEVSAERLEVVSFLHKGVKVTFVDDTSEKRLVFQHDNGITDYLEKVIAERNARPVHPSACSMTRENGARVELALRWTEATDERLLSYVNGIPTGSGGTHELGFRAGLLKAVRNYIDTHKLAPRGVNIAAEDIREGVIGVLSVFIAEPQFQGQTKDRLNNPEVQGVVDGALRPVLEQWLNSNRTAAEQIV